MLAKEVQAITIKNRRQKFSEFYKNELLPTILEAANDGHMGLVYEWFEEYMLDMLCQLGYKVYYYEGKVRIHWD